MLLNQIPKLRGEFQTKLLKTKKKAFKINSIFKVDTQEITDPVDIANRFCSYFSSIGPNLAKEIHSSVSHRSFLSGHFCQSVSFDPVTPNEYRKFPMLFDQVRQLAMIEFPFPS